MKMRQTKSLMLSSNLNKKHEKQAKNNKFFGTFAFLGKKSNEKRTKNKNFFDTFAFLGKKSNESKFSKNLHSFKFKNEVNSNERRNSNSIRIFTKRLSTREKNDAISPSYRGE